jgi:hypothetical protein
MSTDTERPNSMFARAVQDASDEHGGRFARNTQISIAGTEPIPHAAQLAAPTWSHDVVPPEEPLGYCIDELPDMTTASGIDRAQLTPVDADTDTLTDTEEP